MGRGPLAGFQAHQLSHSWWDFHPPLCAPPISPILIVFSFLSDILRSLCVSGNESLFERLIGILGLLIVISSSSGFFKKNFLRESIRTPTAAEMYIREGEKNALPLSECLTGPCQLLHVEND